MKNFKRTLFFLLIVFAIIIYCFQFFKISTNFLQVYKPLNTAFEAIVELDNQNFEAKNYINLNGSVQDYQLNRNYLFFNTFKKIDQLELFLEENLKYKSFFIYNDLKPFYFNSFSSFDNVQKKVCFDNNCKTYNVFDLGNEIDTLSFYNKICVFLLTVFSGKAVFFLSYLLFIFALILNSKYKIIKLNYKLVTIFIFIFAIILRINGFFDPILMYDDYYTIDISNPNLPFKTIFNDPGNPPFLYLLYRLILTVFPLNIFLLKGFSLFISLLFLFICWKLSKKIFGLKIANVFLFLLSINIHFIHRAMELRGYVLFSLLAILNMYLLFKILFNSKKRYQILYFICALMLINLHYYASIFLLGNFIFAASYLLKQNKAKKFSIFILLNFFVVISFLPYLFLTAIKKGLMDESFNSWIQKTDFNMIKSSIYLLFGGGVSLFLYILYSVKFLLKKKFRFKFFVFYSSYIYIFTLLFAILISQYKPILVERYLIFLIPLVLLNISIFLNLDKKNLALFFVWILFIQNSAVVKNNNKNKGYDLIVIEASNQFKEQNKDKNVYSLMRDFTYSKNLYKLNFIKKRSDVNYEVIDTKKIKTKNYIQNILNKDKKAVIFTLLLEMSEENLSKYTCYFNVSKDICLWKIEAE